MKITIETAKKERKQRRKPKVTHNRIWVSVILSLGCIWVSLSYVLAFMGAIQIAEALSETVANVIIATTLGYFAKAYFSKREEERLKYQREKDLKSVNTEERDTYECDN